MIANKEMELLLHGPSFSVLFYYNIIQLEQKKNWDEPGDKASLQTASNSVNFAMNTPC